MNSIETFVRNTEKEYFVENNLPEILTLYSNYCSNRKEYYYSMYEFFKKKNNTQSSNYYLTLFELED